MVMKWILAALLASGVIAATPSLSWSHPLHTTLAEVSIDQSGSLVVTIRAFADDFSAAVARRAGKPKPADFVVPDADVAAYVAATLEVRDSGERTVRLVWTGARRTGDLMWITVRAPGVRSLTGVRVSHSALFDSFPDQVNIVQANENGRRHTVLFTAGDGRAWKPLL